MTVLFLYNSTHGLQVPQQSPFQRWALDAFDHALRHPRTPAAHFFRHNATSSAFLLFNRSPYFVQCHWKLSRCSSLVALPHQLPQFTFVSFSQRMPYLNGVLFGDPTLLFLGLLPVVVVPVVVGRASSGIRFLLPENGVSTVRGHKRDFGGAAAKCAFFVVREHRRRTALPSRRHIARDSINDDRQFRHVAAVANKTENGRVQACVQQFTVNVLPARKEERKKRSPKKRTDWSTNHTLQTHHRTVTQGLNTVVQRCPL